MADTLETLLIKITGVGFDKVKADVDKARASVKQMAAELKTLENRFLASRSAADRSDLASKLARERAEMVALQRSVDNVTGSFRAQRSEASGLGLAALAALSLEGQSAKSLQGIFKTVKGFPTVFMGGARDYFKMGGFQGQGRVAGRTTDTETIRGLQTPEHKYKTGLKIGELMRDDMSRVNKVRMYMENVGRNFSAFVKPLVTKATEFSNKLVNAFKMIGEGFSKMVNTMAVGFAAATGILYKLLQAADPVGFQVFQTSIEVLELELGRIFIPLLQEVIGWIDRVSDYFANLTNEQRENILRWVKLGVVVLGVGAAFAVIGKVVGLVVSILTGLGTVIVGLVRVAILSFSLIKAAIFGVMAAMRALFVLAIAHPFMAILAAIGLVVGALLTLSGAFSGVGDTVGTASRKIMELEALLEELQKGGQAKQKDLSKVLTPEQQERVANAGDDPKKQKKVWQEILEEEKRALANEPGEQDLAKRAAAVRKALTDKKDWDDFWSTPGNRAKERMEELYRRLQEMGLTKEQIEQEVMHGKAGLADQPNVGEKHMKAETIEDMTKRIWLQFMERTARVAFAKRAIEQGGVGGRNNEFTPTMTPKAPELMPVVDAWRKAQTAQQNDPRMRLLQRQLQLQEEAAERDKAKRKALDDLARRRGGMRG